MLLPSAAEAENDSPKLVEALEYLHGAGMSQQHLREIHQSDNGETYHAAIAYRVGRGEVRYGQGNPDFHRRLLYIAAEHWRTGRAFSELVHAALRLFPKVIDHD